jgi:MoaA/NifB/PqqE/SkfB family radical SAM enzyme
MEIIYNRFDWENLKRLFHIKEKKPIQVQIEITNNCNLRCNMCPVDDFKLPRENMKYEVFKKIVEAIPYVKFVIPNGWGEPFIHPDFQKIVDLLKNNEHKIKLTTNGLLLDNQNAIETAMKIDYLAFSVDEIYKNVSNIGHCWNDQTIANRIREIIKIRNQKGVKKPYISIQQVIYSGNKDTVNVIQFASELKADRVNIIRPFTKFNPSLASSWEERSAIYKTAEKLGKKLNIRIDMFEYAFFDGYKRFLWKYFKWLFGFNKWCPRLYDFVYITIDEKVTPCCELPRYIVGDLKTQSLEEIWNGNAMKNYRKNHKEICKNCHIYKIKN